jgi:hypothetical protein
LLKLSEGPTSPWWIEDPVGNCRTNHYQIGTATISLEFAAPAAGTRRADAEVVMSFVLFGSTRELRFSGEAPVVSPEAFAPPSIPLGRPRVRRAQSSERAQLEPKLSGPPRVSPWPTGDWNVSTRDDARRVVVKTLKAPVLNLPVAVAMPSLRRKIDDMKKRIVPNAPASADAQPASCQAVPARLGAGPTLAMWIVAAALLGVLSYHLAPRLVSHFDGHPRIAAR